MLGNYNRKTKGRKKGIVRCVCGGVFIHAVFTIPGRLTKGMIWRLFGRQEGLWRGLEKER